MATANPEKGEVALTVHRDDGTRDYVLKLSINAAVALEKKRKKTFAEIVAEVERLDMEVIRDIAFVLLQKYHKDEIKTVEAAGDLMDDAGGMESFFEAFRELVKVNEPPKGDGKTDPPVAATTTGADPSGDGSFSSPAAAA